MALRKLLQSAKKSKFSTGAAVGVGINGFFAASDYNTAKSEGQSSLGAGVYAASQFAMGEILGLGGILALGAVKGVPSMAMKGAEGLGKIQRTMDRSARSIPFQNAVFNDYNQAFTMRQAGMKAAEQSKYNLQQTLMGNEAAHLKR